MLSMVLFCLPHIDPQQQLTVLMPPPHNWRSPQCSRHTLGSPALLRLLSYVTELKNCPKVNANPTTHFI